MVVDSASGVLKTVDGDEAKPAAEEVTLASMPAAEITALVHCFQKERGVTCGWVGSHFVGRRPRSKPDHRARTVRQKTNSLM